MIFVTFSGVSPTLALSLVNIVGNSSWVHQSPGRQPRKWKILRQQTSPVPKHLHKTQLTMRGPSWCKPRRWLAAGATEGNPQTQSAQGSTIAATRTAGNWRRAYPAHPGDPHQPHQAQQAEVPENPNFNCSLLKLPAETKLPVPVFLARLPAWYLRAVQSSTCILRTRIRARDGAERQSIASSHQQLLS